jgi:hypothetical protein
MVIIAYLGKDVKEYRETSQRMLAGLKIYCPNHPDKEMKNHAHYTRRIKETGEEIEIQRLICRECKETISVLPDFLQPNKQYSAKEIEAVIIESETADIYEIETPASVYTIRRWIKEMKGKIQGWISILKAIMVMKYGIGYSEAEMAGQTPIEQIREIYKKLPKIKFSGNLIGYAGIYTSGQAIPT